MIIINAGGCFVAGESAFQRVAERGEEGYHKAEAHRCGGKYGGQGKSYAMYGRRTRNVV